MAKDTTSPFHAYLVIDQLGGLFNALLDPIRAHEAAQAIGGVVVELPISADYRPTIIRVTSRNAG